MIYANFTPRDSKYRAAWNAHISSEKPQYFITLATNWLNIGPKNRERIQRLFLEFLKRVNRKLNGPRWRKYPEKDMSGWWMIEHPNTNIHIHMLASFPETHSPEHIEKCIKDAWTKLAPSGTVDFQPVRDLGVVAYTTKTVRNGHSIDLPEPIFVPRNFN